MIRGGRISQAYAKPKFASPHHRFPQASPSAAFPVSLCTVSCGPGVSQHHWGGPLSAHFWRWSSSENYSDCQIGQGIRGSNTHIIDLSSCSWGTRVLAPNIQLSGQLVLKWMFIMENLRLKGILNIFHLWCLLTWLLPYRFCNSLDTGWLTWKIKVCLIFKPFQH